MQQLKTTAPEAASACACLSRVEGLEAEITALKERLDAQDEAWQAWHDSCGCESGRPKLSAVGGSGF